MKEKRCKATEKTLGSRVNPLRVEPPSMYTVGVFWAGKSCLFMFVSLYSPSWILCERTPSLFGVSTLRLGEQKHSRARRKRLHCTAGSVKIGMVSLMNYVFNWKLIPGLLKNVTLIQGSHAT